MPQQPNVYRDQRRAILNLKNLLPQNSKAADKLWDYYRKKLQNQPLDANDILLDLTADERTQLLQAYNRLKMLRPERAYPIAKAMNRLELLWAFGQGDLLQGGLAIDGIDPQFLPGIAYILTQTGLPVPGPGRRIRLWTTDQKEMAQVVILNYAILNALRAEEYEFAEQLTDHLVQTFAQLNFQQKRELVQQGYIGPLNAALITWAIWAQWSPGDKKNWGTPASEFAIQIFPRAYQDLHTRESVKQSEKEYEKQVGQMGNVRATFMAQSFPQAITAFRNALNIRRTGSQRFQTVLKNEGVFTPGKGSPLYKVQSSDLANLLLKSPSGRQHTSWDAASRAKEMHYLISAMGAGGRVLNPQQYALNVYAQSPRRRNLGPVALMNERGFLNSYAAYLKKQSTGLASEQGEQAAQAARIIVPTGAAGDEAVKSMLYSPTSHPIQKEDHQIVLEAYNLQLPAWMQQDNNRRNRDER